MKFLDLFAGIGGFHLGMQQAGHKCVGYVEWDKFARQSYQAIFNTKGLYNGKDIKSVKGSELPKAAIFPLPSVSAYTEANFGVYISKDFF